MGVIGADGTETAERYGQDRCGHRHAHLRRDGRAPVPERARPPAQRQGFSLETKSPTPRRRLVWLCGVVLRNRERPEWTGDEPFARRRELYVRAAPVFRKHGYRGATLKALANACGLSIPALYRYFPSKRAFALFPLASMYPELHAPAPDVTVGDPLAHLSGWIDGAVAELPNYVLAARLLHEAGFDREEQRRADATLADHLTILVDLVRRAGPHLDGRSAQEVAQTLVNVALGPALTGLEPDQQALGRELRALLRGYGLTLPELPR